MKVTIIDSDDWVGIYLDGYLHYSGHEINIGDDLGLLKLSEKYKFTSTDVSQYWVNDKGNKYLSIYGDYPVDLNVFEGMYK